MIWPEDADGEVLKRLAERGFDFDEVAEIDFNVDFESWPPDPRALSAISETMPDARLVLEEGYVLVKITRLLTYELVTTVQSALSEATADFAGHCDTWGVLVRPTAQ